MVGLQSFAALIAAGACALVALPQNVQAAAQLKRGLSETLGLSPNNLQKNGISMGFLPAWGEPMSPNTASSLNRLLPRPMSIIGAYAQILSSDPNMTQMDPYLNDLMKQPGDKPVFHVALMPAEGLANITQEVAERVADKMASINAMGVPVWLRYAHEMNGNWYAWGQQPEAFIASWNMVTAAVRAKAPETYMLWSPNSMFASDYSVDNIRGGYTPYWPGAENVDIVGLSFYHYGGHQRLNNYPTPGEAVRLMTQFDVLFGSVQKKPIVLSETGAAYTRDPVTFEPAVGNSTESAIKWDWLWQITGPEIRTALPFYRALCWFEVLKNENAAGDTPVKTEDFRIMTGNGTVAMGSRNYFAAQSLVTNYIAPSVSLPGVNSSVDTGNIAPAPAGATSDTNSTTPTSGAVLQYASIANILGAMIMASAASWTLSV